MARCDVDLNLAVEKWEMGWGGILRRRSRRRKMLKITTMKTTWDGNSNATRWVGWEAEELGTVTKTTTKATTIYSG